MSAWAAAEPTGPGADQFDLFSISPNSKLDLYVFIVFFFYCFPFAEMRIFDLCFAFQGPV